MRPAPCRVMQALVSVTVDYRFCTNRIDISTQHQHPFSCHLLENRRNEWVEVATQKIKINHALLKRDQKSPPSDSSGCTSVIIVTITLRLLNPKLVTDPLLKITLNAVQRSIKIAASPLDSVLLASQKCGLASPMLVNSASFCGNSKAKRDPPNPATTLHRLHPLICSYGSVFHNEGCKVYAFSSSLEPFDAMNKLVLSSWRHMNCKSKEKS